ncbi:MAG: hypothetical protein HY718_21760 [Planctomycetes bacterium]|nr:hypothetical protein [Planctomycetota bacterium]
MARNASRKQRQKIKRQRKRTLLRRAEGGSPYRKMAGPGRLKACYVNKDWKERGIASILALKEVPGGGYALGAFLVDLWCTGLKDAWGRIDVGMGDFHKAVDRARGRMEVIPISSDLAWRLVAGGVRFARRNGFRLPPRYERWIAILGNLAECAVADLSDFGWKDGGLHYVGTMEDLRRRLIGSSVETFLSREDVHYTMRVAGDEYVDEYEDEDEYEDGDYLDDEEAAEDDEILNEMKETEDLEGLLAGVRAKGLDNVRRWCFANSIQPHPRLSDALDIILESLLQTPLDSVKDEPSEQELNQATSNIERLLSLETAPAEEELRHALIQLGEYMKQFETPQAFATALGFEGDSGTERTRTVEPR